MSLIVMNKKLISESIRVVFLCLLLAAPVLAGTIPGLANENSPEKFFRLGEEYRLSEGEVKILQGKALKGSPEAADRLYLYYELDRRDNTESLFWEKIAAENGSPKGQYNLGLRLSRDRDLRNRQRAIFWLERAAAKGIKLAAKELNRLKERLAEDNENTKP